MNKRFQGQVAIVAGGARGIGNGIARRLAQEGAKVIIGDMRHGQKPAPEQSNIDFNLLDITQEEEVSGFVNNVYNQYKRLDIMVNCAGIVGPTSRKITDYDYQDFNKVLAVNLQGAFLITKYCIEPMLKHNYGRILHMTSVGGKEGNPGMIGYAASKSGLIGLVKGIGKEYAETGITVNGLAPAVIATEFNENTDPKTLQYMVDKIPMKRLGTVEEVAALSCWIVSKEASFNTGCVFDLSGGRATY
ncbi:SDR family NAD(P)-dependent oxidoreductase [Fulvivirgaceae bacterium BMA10]|uniref:SDR family NAD(P)-dependent oxidoreductase n=1 Tax=Splendidivirga corallicola TaxID=3051826 RepID=A0ABT8KKL3_9BACT|nr:SDR family NAD(P)-dependent oxidoreductase [Fulvivirgaceae bacterium BMA10]